jgi:PadR family transcriptional regulator, regulatory protein PadR
VERSSFMKDVEMLKGTLDMLILKALSWRPRHGYAVASWIRTTSQTAFTVEDRALYLSLHRLEERGLIESEWGVSENNRKAKYYELTSAGQRFLRSSATQWRQYAEAVSRLLAVTLEGGAA